MKNGWPIKKLSDVADSISTGPFGTMLHKSDYVPEGIPLVNPMNIVDSRIVPSAKMMISEETRNRLSNYVLRKGDVVVGRRGELGRCAIVTEKEDGWLCGTGSCFIRLSKQVDEHFFAMLFGSGSIRRLLDDSSVGTTMSNLNHGILNALPIPVPPLSEQRRIVGILDEAFEGLATAKANAEQNLQNARALFESHLQAVFTQRGDGWVEKTLDEIAKVFGRGKSRHRPRNEPSLYGGKYPFIQTGDVRNAGLIIESYTQTYSELGLAQSKLWPTGTVCITIAANIAETAILGFDGCIPDSIIGVVVDEAKADNKFVLYLLKSFKAHLQAQGKGSAQDNINVGTFENQAFPFPSLRVQTKIVATLDSLSEQTQRLESLYQRKLATLDELKKSLLHRAFSGEL